MQRWILSLVMIGMAGILPLTTVDSGAAQERRPVPIIFDSDIGPDVDDAGATAILNAMADRGEARILAMACCTSSEWGAPCLDAINTWYGRKDIPTGTFKGTGFLAGKDNEKYNRPVAQQFPNDLKSGSNAPDATEVYRRALGRAGDGSVVICAVGPLNNLPRLLDSAPDRHSRLSGKDLVARKVKQLVIMGGRYPEGKEWNFEQDRAAAARVMAEWPTLILASGFEIGEKVKTGGRLHTEAPETNPVRAAFAHYHGPGKDRESWDETAVLAAVRGPAPLWDVSPPGTITVNPQDATNRWTASPAGRHTYLIARAPVETVKRTIDDLMIQAPRRR
jgi:inosine-uridine nucleoside N-ribohydrolase